MIAVEVEDARFFREVCRNTTLDVFEFCLFGSPKSSLDGVKGLRDHPEAPVPRRILCRTSDCIGHRRLNGLHQEVTPIANSNRMRKTDLWKRHRVRGTTTTEDTSTSTTVVTTPQDGKRVSTAEAVWGESIGDPWRRSTNNDVIVDVFGYGMLRNNFRYVFSSTGCDIQQGGFWLVELVGRWHRELVNELFAGNVKSKILTVDCSVGLFSIRGCARKRSSL